MRLFEREVINTDILFYIFGHGFQAKESEKLVSNLQNDTNQTETAARMHRVKAYQMPKHCIAVRNTTGSEFTSLEGYHTGNRSGVCEIKSSITPLKLQRNPTGFVHLLAADWLCKMMLHSLGKEVEPASTFMLELCACCTNTQLLILV